MDPTTHFLEQTEYVPNSRFPALSYPGIFCDRAAIEVHDIIEAHKWRKGGVFGHYPRSHFHPNTHECYYVSKGQSTLMLGKGPHDTQREAIRIDARVGDIIVIPAGVSHYWVDSSADYEYVGYYPEGAPKWEMQYGDCLLTEIPDKVDDAHTVPVPLFDPVHGKGGALCKIWNTVA